jgi:hypothetical protein
MAFTLDDWWIEKDGIRLTFSSYDSWIEELKKFNVTYHGEPSGRLGNLEEGTTLAWGTDDPALSKSLYEINKSESPVGRLIGEHIDRLRQEGPPCSFCGDPSPLVTRMTIDGEERWVPACERCEDGLLWSRQGYIPTIRKLLRGYNLKTGERHADSEHP